MLVRVLPGVPFVTPAGFSEESECSERCASTLAELSVDFLQQLRAVDPIVSFLYGNIVA
jgi:hypothetical protein